MTARTFNTEGPVVAADHYHIPPLERIDLDEVLGLVRGKKYFVLHAPRQTGKTSALLALRDLLNGGEAGDFRCVYANVEDGQAMRENVAEGMRTVLAEDAVRLILMRTAGQPWLVNALCREACFDDEAGAIAPARSRNVPSWRRKSGSSCASASTRSTGCNVSSGTTRPDRSCRCRRTCSAS